jgi:chloramphenicol 3-O-phosphotransferase
VIAALILIGAPGAGKSSVLGALMTLLELEGVEYGAIESEQLAMGSPLLPGHAWIRQLEAVLELQRESGSTLFLIVATVENDEELRAAKRAARADSSLVACLVASPDTVATRIAAREPDRWPGKAGLIAHARGLAETVPRLAGIDLRIETEECAAETTAELIQAEMRLRGLLTARPDE